MKYIGSRARQVFCKTLLFSSRQEIVDYLNGLIKINIPEHVAVLIGNRNHAMGFKRSGFLWHFVNITHLFQQHTLYSRLTSEELASRLYRSRCADAKERVFYTSYIGFNKPQKLERALKNKYPAFPINLENNLHDKIDFFRRSVVCGDIACIQKFFQIELSDVEIKKYWSLFCIDAIAWRQSDLLKILIHLTPKNCNISNHMMHLACKRGGMSIVEMLLPITKFTVNTQDSKGRTFLMSACKSLINLGEKKLFEWLLAKGSSLDIQDKKGLTALDYAMAKNNKIAIKLIKTKIGFFKKPADIDASGNKNLGPVYEGLSQSIL